VNGSRSDLAAIILCGGRSSRMGRPKALLPFGPGEVMLQRVVRLVREVVGPVVVVAASDQEVPPLPPDILIVRDPIADRGPLQGLAAGLAALPIGVELAYATATDVPFLEPAWIRVLVERIGAADLAIPLVGGYHQPLAALYRRSPCLLAAGRLIAEGRMRPAFLIEVVRAIVLDETTMRTVDPRMGTIRNLNTPEEYEAALRDL
jgi:molybdopterin-guanine dinucleotide biosynthesis protein A